MLEPNLNKNINLNAVILYTVTIFITAATLVLCIISLDRLESFPDLSISRRMGIPYSPTYGLTRAIWCLLHGNISLAVRYNRLIFFFFPVLAYNYVFLIRQCTLCQIWTQLD